MRLDLYQAETAQTARHYGALLAEVRERLSTGGELSRLEQSGVLHALQVLVENAIGKAKQIIKSRGEPAPVSTDDVFAALARLKVIADSDLPAWNAAIGLRNRIVHEYMNIDMDRVLELVRSDQHQLVTDFLLSPIQES